MIIPSFIEQNITLADKNWFKTGGNAEFFCHPSTPEEFAQALLFAYQQSIPVFLLGKGANILIADDGVPGLTIQPHLTYIHQQTIDDTKVAVTAGAGVDLHSLIIYCLDNGIVGLEEFSGIPSTVGGAVYINLHYFEFLLEHFLLNARVIDAKTGQLMTVDNAWFNFGYNTSRLHMRDYYLVDATFLLTRVDQYKAAFAHGRHTEIIRHRARRYPAKNTCGSFFRNFHEDELVTTYEGKKIPYVAYYLERAGVKGVLQIGDAIVSHQHANMIVNMGNATTDNIITVAQTMQQRVHEIFGIVPQPECQLIGFKNYPLLR